MVVLIVFYSFRTLPSSNCSKPLSSLTWVVYPSFVLACENSYKKFRNSSGAPSLKIGNCALKVVPDKENFISNVFTLDRSSGGPNGIDSFSIPASVSLILEFSISVEIRGGGIVHQW